MFVFANKLSGVKRVVCFPKLPFLRYKWWEHPDQTLGAIWNVDAHHPLLHAKGMPDLLSFELALGI